MSGLTDSAKFNSTSSYYASNGGAGGSGVSSLDGLTGAVALTSTGASIAITTVGQNINLESLGSLVTAGSGQLITGTPTGTFWEVGNFLFCAVLISTNTLTPGLGSFTLPAGKAWTSNTQASWPQIICSGLSGTTGGVGGALIANAQSNQPGTGVNNILTVQCTNASGVGTPANVNVLAFGPKAP